MASRILCPFFNYYGGKFRISGRYPKPMRNRIVEPFAGAAGYSLKHFRHDVVLIDKDPTIIGIWRYLIGASHADIMSLPVIGDFETTKELDHLPQGAKDLIGFGLNTGAARPCRTASAWARSGQAPGSFWTERRREKVAAQVGLISHWSAHVASYDDIGNENATWFVDPPYQGRAGSHYRMSSKDIDYSRLGEWCAGRCGQVIVCEADGARWLPFESLGTFKATTRKGGRWTAEAVWSDMASGQMSLFHDDSKGGEQCDTE